MRAMRLLFTTLAIFLSCSLIAQREGSEKVEIDLRQSKLEWTGKKLGGEHYGEIQLTSGYLLIDKKKLTGGSFEMDMASITCVDITDAKSNKRLVDHLKSEDFFSVTRFPTSSFVITKVEYKSAEEYVVTGDLTIKGKTNPTKFTARVYTTNSQTVAEAKLVFDRSNYEVKFGSQSFFDNLGDKLVYDDVEMNVRLVLLSK